MAILKYFESETLFRTKLDKIEKEKTKTKFYLVKYADKDI